MKKVKRSISTKLVGSYTLDKSQNLHHHPKVGDVAVFEILQLGKHTTLQSPQASNTYLFAGDRMLGTFGNRYATQVFEGVVPTQPQEIYHILGKGGVVGVVRHANAKTASTGPTLLKLIGYATDQNTGTILNTRTLAAHKAPVVSRPTTAKIVLSVGSTMDSGKTTTAGYLCGGLQQAGFKTAFIKLTGTVFAKDTAFVASRGADLAIDFTEMGYPSTYLCSLTELLQLHHSLLQIVQQKITVDYIVIEIADGLLQRETNKLLSNPEFMNTVDEVIFSAGDSLGVLGGLQLLKQLHITPFAISGCVTISPMLVHEIQAKIKQPIFDLEGLLNDCPRLLQKISVPSHENRLPPVFSEGVIFALAES